MELIKIREKRIIKFRFFLILIILEKLVLKIAKFYYTISVQLKGSIKWQQYFMILLMD